MAGEEFTLDKCITNFSATNADAEKAEGFSLIECDTLLLFNVGFDEKMFFDISSPFLPQPLI